jgi:hypothetical protein
MVIFSLLAFCALLPSVHTSLESYSLSFAFPQAAVSFSPKISVNSWHAGGVDYWNAIKNIVPKSYDVLRVNPDKPVLFDSGDIFSDCWEHAPWTDKFVDIEGPEKYGPLP